MNKINAALILFPIVGSIFTVCGGVNAAPDNRIEEAVIPVEVNAVLPVFARKPFSADEVEVIAQTLAGECYDDKLTDKRRVAEVIVNRASDGRFGETVVEVVTARGQFYGYWKRNRPVSESDVQIAEETLHNWYANDCKALSEYLFFRAGPNRENAFRVEY
jgi:hypothetical protein